MSDSRKPPFSGNKPARPYQKANGSKPVYGRPAANSSDGKSYDGKKPYPPKPTGGKPMGGKPAYGRPDNSGSNGERPVGDKPSFAKPTGARPAGDRPYRAKPAGDKPTGDRPSFGRPAMGRPSGGKPGYGRPSFAKPAGDKPTGDRPAFGRPASARPTGGKPGFGRPGGAKPAFRPSRDPSKATERNALRPAAPASSMSMGARKLALNILQDVHRDGSYASLALDKRLKESGLSALDKRLAANIVYGTLENRIRIDYALDTLLTNKDVEPLSRDILRLSAYQILFLDKVPDSAAVNEGVKLCKEAGMEPLSGFINGVLRNLIRQKDEIAWPSREENETLYLSIMHSVPQWLVERLMAAYGAEMTEAICSYRTQQHDTPIRPNRMQLTDEAFEQLLSSKVWKAEKAQVPHVWRIGGALDIGIDTDYRKGMFSIQGESSVLAAEAVGVKRGMQVLDACAAPGGKSALMAEIMDGTGRVHAWDLHAHRVALIQAVAKRLKLENLRPMVRDAAVNREELINTFDAVLLDAPCSGLGVMLEKPDVKYRQTPETVASLVETQKKLLDVCSQYVKKGGVLVYATCSILPEENSQQIAAFLQTHKEFEMSPLPDAIPEKFRALYGANGLQLFAHRDGLEGFYIARLVKKEA